MPRENQDNWQSVADRLDGLEILPGDAPLDREAAWTGLASRLHAPSRQRLGWWWAAAAVLLFGSGITVLLREKSWKDPAVTNYTLGIIPVPANARENGIPQNAAATPAHPRAAGSYILLPATAAAKRIREPFTADKQWRSKADPGKKSQTPPVASVAAHNHQGRDTINSIPTGSHSPFAAILPDSAAGAPVATLRKPIRVVYLSELDAPAPQAMQQNPLDQGLLTARRRNPLRLNELSLHPAKHPNPVSASPALFSINLNRSE